MVGSTILTQAYSREATQTAMQTGGKCYAYYAGEYVTAKTQLITNARTELGCLSQGIIGYQPALMPGKSQLTCDKASCLPAMSATDKTILKREAEKRCQTRLKTPPVAQTYSIE